DVFSWRLFFFSSRRRHTRSKRDWSSDVCSSDLQQDHLELDQLRHLQGGQALDVQPAAAAVEGLAEQDRHQQHQADQVACPHELDRKSTRLNSSHVSISYAVFCLKKKKQKHNARPTHKQSTHTAQTT